MIIAITDQVVASIAIVTVSLSTASRAGMVLLQLHESTCRYEPPHITCRRGLPTVAVGGAQPAGLVWEVTSVGLSSYYLLTVAAVHRVLIAAELPPSIARQQRVDHGIEVVALQERNGS